MRHESVALILVAGGAHVMFSDGGMAGVLLVHIGRLPEAAEMRGTSMMNMTANSLLC